MATTKKTTTKKSTAKSTVKKAPTKKKAAPRARTTTIRTKKKPVVKSFQLAKPEKPFMTFEITRQTVYWLVLGVVVIVFGAWIMKLQTDIQSIYDSIDSSSSAIEAMPLKKK